MNKSQTLIRWMRIANGILVISLIVYAIVLVFRGKHAWQEQLLGPGIFVCLFSVLLGTPVYLASRGLGPHSTTRMVRKPRLANIIAAGLFVPIPIDLILFLSISDQTWSFVELLTFIGPLLMYTACLALNIKALALRQVELDQKNVEQVAEHREAQAMPDVAVAISASAFSGLSSPPLVSSNYFVRHWRGELSLDISYWLNGGIVNGFVLVFAPMIINVTSSLFALMFATLGILLFSVIALPWSNVGIWRSASHHVARGGSSRLVNWARVSVVIGTMTMSGILYTVSVNLTWIVPVFYKMYYDAEAQ